MGAFRRDVRGFISNIDIETPSQQYYLLRINRPANGGSGRLQGLEAQFTSFLDIDGLPAWARAFSIQANYTYIDSGSELPVASATLLPGRQRVAGVSKNAYNLVGLFETAKVSARLAYNYRGRYVEQYEIFQGIAGPRYVESLGTLDLSATITPIRNVTIAFDATNLLGRPVRYDRPFDLAGDSYPVRRRYLDRVYSLGLRFRL